MSERKVLNKYYPPDFDPNKIPKLKQPKNRVYTIRTMAPFNMRCNTCGEYIYKGKKFNSRTETVEGEKYLGSIYIRRFYIRCPQCVAEISFKTDPENTDYTLEAGATRNFEAMKTASEMAKKEQQEKEEEEANNPMKVLENRTKASRNEMEAIEKLEELRDRNAAHAKVDLEHMLKLNAAYEEKLKQLQDEEDEKFINSIFGKGSEETVKRLHDDSDDEEDNVPKKKMNTSGKPTDILAEDSLPSLKNGNKTSQMKKESTNTSLKSLKGMLVKKKETVLNSTVPKPDVEVGQASSSKNTSLKSLKGQLVKPKTSNAQNSAAKDRESNVSLAAGNAPASAGALGLLGNYSDSASDSD